MEPIEVHREQYTISTDPSRLDLVLVHHFLSTQSYWAKNRTLEAQARAVQNSLNFGVYAGLQQVGYARVVADYATFAWLCDVFILPEYRGLGLSKWLVQTVIDHPDLRPIRRLLLATRDAHELYRKYGGFDTLPNPERWMERFNPDA